MLAPFFGALADLPPAADGKAFHPGWTEPAARAQRPGRDTYHVVKTSGSVRYYQKKEPGIFTSGTTKPPPESPNLYAEFTFYARAENEDFHMIDIKLYDSGVVTAPPELRWEKSGQEKGRNPSYNLDLLRKTLTTWLARSAPGREDALAVVTPAAKPPPAAPA